MHAGDFSINGEISGDFLRIYPELSQLRHSQGARSHFFYQNMTWVLFSAPLKINKKVLKSRTN